jgi:hypothetical protein
MSSYYRSILNVQAVEAFVPTDISGCQLWLDAADDTTISIGTGVSQWDDKSGNARHATQAVGANQPAYITAGKNGLNLVRFDGSNDRLTLPEFLSNPSLSIYIVRKVTTAGDRDVFVDYGNTGEKQLLMGSFAGLGQNSMYVRDGSGVQLIRHNFAVTSNYEVIGFKLDAPNKQAVFRVNNTRTTVTNASYDSSTTWEGTFGNPTIGALQNSSSGTLRFFLGDVCEKVVYNEVISDSDETKLYNYLKDKWDI